MNQASARAHANIALVKYWGKRIPDLNLPAVGSISMTLSGFFTTTTVAETQASSDRVVFQGRDAPDDMAGRTLAFLDRLRRKTGVGSTVRVETENNFPTASGLASSASGFAALVAAFAHAFDLNLDDRRMGVLMRLGSGSAPRSLFGGYVEMLSGTRDDGEDAYATPLAPPEHWDLRLVVAVNSQAEKKTGSTQGMEQTRRTSPYWRAWVEAHAPDLAAARRAIADKDFETLGRTAEHNAMAMHAAIMASRPSIVYWNPVTLACLEAVSRLRDQGVACHWTIDAGPHVKVLCLPHDADTVASTLSAVPGVSSVHAHAPGPGVQRLS